MDVCLEREVAAQVRVADDQLQCVSCRDRLSSPAVAGTPPTEGPTSVPALAHDLAPPTRFGRYVFAGEIGVGGMGVVYAAHDPELDRVVAVKLLRGHGDARLQGRLRREAQVMARVAHPNVVAIHDVGVFEDRVFIAMEYVEGDTLAQWIARPRSVREILEAYCAAGRGLAAAHAAGIVHRDFKPENVLVGKDGRVRVGDFGLARSAGIASAAGPRARPSAPAGAAALHRAVTTAPGAAPGLTAPGTLLGTRYYMAPELYKGVDADARSDQFSFCVALSTALHGKRPLDGDPTSRLWNANSPRVPRRIRAALRRGLSLDPAARFASLDELLAELESSPRRRALWAIGAAAVFAVIALHVADAPTVPAACDASASSSTMWWSDERVDGGKPSASAVLDPDVVRGAAGRTADAARCNAPHAPRRTTRAKRHITSDVRPRPIASPRSRNRPPP